MSEPNAPRAGSDSLDAVSQTARIGMGGSLYDGLTTAEWYTPPHVFDALGLRFHLDPCAPPGGVPWLPAAVSYSLPHDGLRREWAGRVWLNPPYGRETSKWVDRLVDHGNGVALVFARTDAAWAQRAIKWADAVCLIAGRLSFIDGTGRERKGHNAAAASMLLGYGECADAVLDCGLGIPFRPPVREAVRRVA